jgi:hypothetical protein
MQSECLSSEFLSLSFTPDTGGLIMALVTRIIGVSLLTSGLGAGLGFALFGTTPDWSGISIFLGCAGGTVGAVAGAAREIVAALRENRSS